MPISDEISQCVHETANIINTKLHVTAINL